jgi:arylsulfatase A-like enzyme
MPRLEKPLSTKAVVALAVLAGGLLSLAFSLASYEPYLAKLGLLRGGRERSAVHGRDGTRRTERPAERPARLADLVERTVIAELNSGERPVSAASPDALADLVVLISVDGLRPDVLFPHAPNIRRMQSEGTSAVSARTISKSSTLASHASMVSGVDFPRHGLAFNAYRPDRGHIQFPTIFSAAQGAGLSTALFVGKRKLRHLLNPDTESHFEVGGVYCSRVNKLAIPYIEAAEPGIVFLHFSDPDGAGHLHGWMSPEYLAAVGRADRCVGHVRRALARRGGGERTLVILTADHGGHDHDHATPILPDTHIPWIAWGGPVNRQVRVQRLVYNTDTAASILYALGLPMPADIEGKPVFEALARQLPVAAGR